MLQISFLFSEFLFGLSEISNLQGSDYRGYTVYIKYTVSTQTIICTAKSLVDLFSLQINQLIHVAMWVDSVCSFMRNPFQLIHKASADSRS